MPSVSIRPGGGFRCYSWSSSGSRAATRFPSTSGFKNKGARLPDGLRYIESWVEANFDRCFQLMECDEAVLLQQWVLQWRDLAEFEIVPVSPSKSVRNLFSTTEDPRD